MRSGIFLLAALFLLSCSREAKVYGHAPFGTLLTVKVGNWDVLKVRPGGVRDNLGLSILNEALYVPLRDTVVLGVRLDSSGHLLIDTSLVFLRRNKEPFIWVGPSYQPPHRWVAAVGDDSETIKY